MFPLWHIALHAGTPPVVSQTIMTVMFVSLGILLMGIGYGYIGKSKENLLQHRWALSAAVALTLGAILLGMIPSFVRYYIDSRCSILLSPFRNHNTACGCKYSSYRAWNNLCLWSSAKEELEEMDALDCSAMGRRHHNRGSLVPSNVRFIAGNAYVGRMGKGVTDLFSDFILIVSQTNLSLMFVILAILVIGVGYGLFAKTKERLLLHRWGMSVALALSSGAILLVMIPTAFNYFIDPNLQFPSSLSFLTLIHAIIGVPAVTLGLIYAFGDLPQKVRFWMRWAAVFWVATFVLGVALFMEMMGYLPF